MPEISLKEYFAKLNNLLSTNAADEVIHHCRHILKYYPKNVTAYRFLGRALVNNGRWDEGREALRRVLSVIPDDYAAHLGLSEANERTDRSDEAIWHLERAFEQRPNDKELIDALRGLYRRHRQIENLKIQLTSATVARQYLRSGAYAQAIDTLRSALTRMKERIDLKVLLAQILWEHGSQEEAADIAVDVLKLLPDCLEANRIMAELWLTVERPSDAQRYVNRLESIDPYLAVELVQGFPPDDDAFRLDELDYVRSAQQEMAGARPDWLQEISGTAANASESNKESSDDEMSNWASAMLGGQTATGAFGSDDEEPTSGLFDTPLRDKPEEKISTSGLTGVFGRPDEVAPEEAEELSALFGASDESADPMAWLRGAGVEIVEEEEEPSYDVLFGVEDEIALPEPDENPMAWIQSSGDDLLLDSEQPILEEEDPFAWMSDNLADSPTEVQAQPDDQETGDSLDWLQSDPLQRRVASEQLAA